MEFRTLLIKPKIMAYSGIIAMFFKFFVIIVIMVVSGVPMLFFLYPIVAFIVDIILYVYKDNIWTTLPENIPSNWEITQEQLLEYSKNLPKIRLMRFLTCWMYIPILNINGACKLTISNIITRNECIEDLMTMISAGFLLSSYFDEIWLYILKIKKPVLIFKYNRVLFKIISLSLLILFYYFVFYLSPNC